MKTKVLFISKVEDLESLRNIDDDTRITMFLTDNLDFKGKTIEPIEFNSKVDLVIYGLNFGISNLKVAYNDSLKQDYVGLFSRVNNLYIKDINITNVCSSGRNIVGSLVGEVNNKLNVKNSTIISSVHGCDFVGGICGYAYKTKISDSVVASKVSSIDNYTTGISVGLINYFKDKNCSFIDLNDKNLEETNENKAGPKLVLIDN